MVSLSLLVICFFSKSLAFETKTSTGAKKHYIPELKPNLKVLVEALNTNERIWLKMLTYVKEYVTCLYFEKLELKNNTYNYTYVYNERYRKIHQRKTILFNATLYEGRGGPVMDVRYSASKGGKAVPHVLKFWDPYEKCAIFTLPVSYTSDPSESLTRRDERESKQGKIVGHHCTPWEMSWLRAARLGITC
uniref:Lipocalin n=1 Tax=Rhipicephalus zambeziensis TaxID=60191 RepID=A0A224YLS7_9ACAR